MATYTIDQTRVAHFLFFDTRSAPLWLIVRLYLGWIWLSGAFEKMFSSYWTGDRAGRAIENFVSRAAERSKGPLPDVHAWYAAFLENVIVPHSAVWSYIIIGGEFLIGIALLTGVLVGAAAFFSALLSGTFLLAGTVAENPLLIILSILLFLAWRVAGYWGADSMIVPKILEWLRRKGDIIPSR